MPMFVEIFLMCIIAQPQVFSQVQPLKVNSAESATMDHHSTIFSRIKDAGSCNAFKDFKSEPKFRQLEEYCERPLPSTPRGNGFVSYEIVLCMVLYDAAQHVCKAGHQESTKDIQNFSDDFSCDTMIKQVPDAFDESTKQWLVLFKEKLANITDCDRACIQDKTISPVCEYIWKANTLIYPAQMSSSFSADMSPTENPQVNQKGNGKTNKKMTSRNKPVEAKASDLSSSADPGHSVRNDGSQNTEQVEHKTSTYKPAVYKVADHAEANGNSTQSGSANYLKNNVEEEAHTKDGNVQNNFTKQAQAAVNTGHNDAKKQTYTAGSNTQNNINKQAHGANSSVQNITKKQEHATNNSNHSAEVTSHSDTVSLPVKHNDSTGKSISSDSKSNTALQPENKSSVSVYTSSPDMGNQNDDDDFVMPTNENPDKDEDKDVADNIQSGDQDQEEDRINSEHQEEQSNQIPKQTETHQKEAATMSTAQFNQLGDAADSHFYAYFMTMVVICIIGYLVFHNKQKILALALEGRSRRGTRRRPNTSAYRKLDSNLEEAVTSTGSTSVTHVIY